MKMRYCGSGRPFTKLFKFRVVLSLYILLELLQINCQRLNRNRDKDKNGKNERTSVTLEDTTTYMPTTQVLRRRTTFRRRRETTQVATIGITQRQRPAVVNINVKVKDKTKRVRSRPKIRRRKNRNRVNRRRRKQAVPQQRLVPLGFFDRLRLLFTPLQMTPLMSRLLNPYANQNWRQRQRRSS